MPHSSQWSRLAAELGLTLLLFAATELGFRWVLSQHADFPMPRLFSTVIATGKVLAFDRVDWDHEPLDVLFLGLSPMMRVNGTHFRDVLAERYEIAARPFNLAGPLQSAELSQRLLETIVLGRRKPSIVIFGIMPISLIRERSPATIDLAVQQQPGFQLLERRWPSRLRWAVISRVKLLLYREVIREKLSGSAAIDPFTERARATDDLGDIILLHSSKPVTKPGEYDLRYAKSFRDFDAHLRAGVIFRSLRKLARFCEQNGIQLVVVNTPVHPLFLDNFPEGQKNYTDFLRRTRSVVESNSALFFDPADGRPGRPEYFQDSHHHNLAGSMWLTEQIADFVALQELLGQAAPVP